MTQTEPRPAGWILYDDSCGICRRWVPFWERTLQRRGFLIAPLQADWVPEKIKLTETELMQDLRLLLPNGKFISGADTYRYAMRRIWWAMPLYWFSIAPGGRNAFNYCYRKFADNRFKLSSACGLSNPPGK
jgi:predicted DCC family thiol-disulfide oxidoreductase YuxK